MPPPILLLAGRYEEGLDLLVLEEETRPADKCMYNVYYCSTVYIIIVINNISTIIYLLLLLEYAYIMSLGEQYY